jgi:ATP-dependent DNA helicase RecG
MPDSPDFSLALEALARIGPGWEADNAEREALDFKQTPHTALPEAQRTNRNMSRERGKFLTEMAEHATCFANGTGGIIVLGVADKAATRQDALAGVPANYTAEDVRLAIFRNSSPGLTVDVREHLEDGVRLLLVRVPQGVVVHSTQAGVFKRRIGDQCLPIGAIDMRALQAARGQHDWSEGSSTFGPSDVSVEALARAATRLRRAGNGELADLAENDRAQFLADCGLLDAGKLRRAGVLLYGNDRALTQTVSDYGLLLSSAPSPGAEGSVLLRRQDTAERPIVLLVDDVLARLNALASTETIRVGAAEVELTDYPDDVARELLANAFAHRDWELPGVIEVTHSPDELVFSSPGNLLPGVHRDRLLRETAQRNRLLAREIARLRIAEGAGLGFDRVWRNLASQGKEPPVVEPGAQLRVVVPGGQGDKSFARFLNGTAFPADSRLASDLDILLILSALRHRRTINAPRMAPALQVDAAAAARALARAAEAGLIEATKRTAGRSSPDYRLTPASTAGMRNALTYRTTTIDSEELKLVRHLKRHGRISNEDVRSYLDCDVPTARNRLTALRRKNWIAFAPDSPKRGPHVEYVKTPLLDSLDIDA